GLHDASRRGFAALLRYDGFRLGRRLSPVSRPTHSPRQNSLHRLLFPPAAVECILQRGVVFHLWYELAYNACLRLSFSCSQCLSRRRVHTTPILRETLALAMCLARRTLRSVERYVGAVRTERSGLCELDVLLYPCVPAHACGRVAKVLCSYHAGRARGWYGGLLYFVGRTSGACPTLLDLVLRRSRTAVDQSTCILCRLCHFVSPCALAFPER